MEEANLSVEEKRFPEWMERKECIHNVGRLPAISEREVWWVAVGENVGVEINGKSGRFSRPVLVYNAALAQIRVMSVSRLYGNAIGQISRADFKAICKGFDNLYHFDFPVPLE